MATTATLTTGVNQKAYPQFLFKYRSDSSFTENIFKNNELWFCNPLDFNDPYDCNTPINVDTPLAEIKKWLIDVGIHPEGINELAARLKQNPNIMKIETERAIKNTGVCCFSTLDDSILQWSHYSDYHKGICIKFDILEDPNFFMIPVIVGYRQIMQHYNHFINSNQIIEYLIKPKFHDWSYESEIRVVKIEKLIHENGNKRAFRFKESALKEVIFGTNTPDPIITKYRQLCANHNKGHVQFYKMELGTGAHYQLIKKPV
jgi:Protein of unknown function (DUF2971)